MLPKINSLKVNLILPKYVLGEDMISDTVTYSMILDYDTIETMKSKFEDYGDI